MKKLVLFLATVTLFLSCKEDVVKKPAGLIKKDVMVDIIYDISLLDAIKYQNPKYIDSFKINPQKFILKKYKVDSLQFANSNVYYSADYENYKLMFDEVAKRLEQKETVTDSLIKLESKKLKKAKKTKISEKSIPVDTLVRGRKQLINKNVIKQPVLQREALQ
ncbi:DUF4296 domain-containing protein [Flavobacterium weaverense]|uniref:Uncharacterized protein DUF4296 n=1 Tax=Flavobacterium weaverense TaxID=271156 RepID=A0A3M0ADP6_9FLAO|nr:DUF4296 domain-containing protein [Flavobacterium weaverense]RMA77272.1 uncharacterized protein DUF4296 [Flavobacterium weaverense]